MFNPRIFASSSLFVAAAAALLGSCSKLHEASAVERLRPCLASEGPTEAYCGIYDVWEDRQARSGRRIPLKIVLLPALKQDYAPDPLFVLAGGPGEGAAQSADAAQDLFRSIQRTRDIVLIDQRGTGESNPLTCKRSPGHRLPADSPSAVEGPLRACLEELQARADLTKYTTDVAMDDLDDVRAFLGYAKINVYGVSYGTRAAIVYARRHADRTRTVVLDSVAPTNFRVPLFIARDSQRALDLLIEDCRKDPVCNKRFPALQERVNRLLADLEAHRQRIRYTDPGTGVPVEVNVSRLTIATALGAALESPATAALIPLLIEQGERGNFSGFLALLDAFEHAAQSAQGLYYSVVCSEDAPQIEAGAIEREAAGTFLGPEFAHLRLKPCEFWPRAKVDPTYFEDVSSNIPALLLSGELDPLTPPRWAEQVAQKWKNARKVIVPATGHRAVSAAGVIKLVEEFVEKGDGSKLDTSFLRRLKRPPFFLSPSGPIAGQEPDL